jgi:endonuclease YncB( thermonuclease family)
MYLPQQSAKAASAPLRLMAVDAPPQGHSLGNATCKAEAEAEAEVMGKGKFKPRPFE